MRNACKGLLLLALLTPLLVNAIDHLPRIGAIPDDSVEEGTPYTGPTPSVSGSISPVTFSLQTGPSGMTINGTTGVVSWTSPTVTGSPHTVTIRVTNSTASDDETWLLTVTADVIAPQDDPHADESVVEGTPYTGPTPSLSSGTTPVTWSLQTGPSGMTINGTTGVVSWTSPTAVGSPHTITIRASNSVGSDDETWMLTVTSAEIIPPTLPPNSVVNGASFRAATESGGAVAPGSIVSIFGTDLAGTTEAASAVPLPTTLGDTTVTFNGIEAPLFAISAGQINAQVPFTLLPGEVSVQVKRGSEASAVQTVAVAAVSPGIFALSQNGTGQGAVLIANSAIFAAPSGAIPGQEARPANRLEFISIFCSGLGDVTNRPPSGEPPSGGGASVTLTTPTATIGGVEVPVSFSGLSSFVGLYQVNVQVPSNAPTGNAIEVVLTIGGVTSNTVTIAVQ
ncbi:MAG: putative Ig domain-containing protein [Acidobacteria bacterium]|nr:putative Ig domain-containing protein [Acidobacteriota bacterium]